MIMDCITDFSDSKCVTQNLFLLSLPCSSHIISLLLFKRKKNGKGKKGERMLEQKTESQEHDE